MAVQNTIIAPATPQRLPKSRRTVSSKTARQMAPDWLLRDLLRHLNTTPELGWLSPEEMILIVDRKRRFYPPMRTVKDAKAAERRGPIKNALARPRVSTALKNIGWWREVADILFRFYPEGSPELNRVRGELLSAEDGLFGSIYAAWQGVYDAQWPGMVSLIANYLVVRRIICEMAGRHANNFELGDIPARLNNRW